MSNRSAVIALVLGSALGTAATLNAQASGAATAPDRATGWSLIVPSGTLIPTGAQSHAIKRGNMSAIQLTYAPVPTLALTSTVGWARSRDVSTANDPKLDVFTYDVGAELRAPGSGDGARVTFTPFAGLGAGGRSYNYRSLDVGATHNLAGYVSAGGDLRVRRVGVRLETRDYVTGFKPLTGIGDRRSANDVVVLVGLRLFSR